MIPHHTKHIAIIYIYGLQVFGVLCYYLQIILYLSNAGKFWTCVLVAVIYIRLLLGNYLVVIQLPCAQIRHFCATCLKDLSTDRGIWVVSIYFNWIMTGATCGTEKYSLFSEHLISLPWKIHNFTHSFNGHCRICQSMRTICLRINDPDLFAWINLTALSWTYF